MRFLMTFDSRNFFRLAHKAVAPFLTVTLIGYFVYHSIQGNRGILAWVRLNEQLHKKEDVLKGLEQERQLLETKIRCLRPESLDRDLLELQVRSQLGYTHPDEIVVLTLDEPSKSPEPQKAVSEHTIVPR